MIKNQLPKKVYSTGKEVINWKEVKEGFEVEVDGQTVIVVKNDCSFLIQKNTEVRMNSKTNRIRDEPQI